MDEEEEEFFCEDCGNRGERYFLKYMDLFCCDACIDGGEEE